MAAKSGWGGLTLGFFAVGLSASIALVPVERRSPSPLFEPRLMRVSIVRRSLASVAMTWVTFFGLLTAVPFYVERNLGRSTSVAGATTVAIPVGIIMMAPFIGRLLRRFTRRTIALGASAVITVAMAAITAEPSQWWLVGLLVLVGVGVGTSNTLNSTTVMDCIEIADRGVASGLINLARAGGSAVGVAIAATVIELSGVHSVQPAIAALLGSAVVGLMITAWPQRN